MSGTYFENLFSKAHTGDGLLQLRTGDGRTQWADVKTIAHFGEKLCREARCDLFFTFSSYKKGKNGHMKRDTAHLCNIYAWSVDVDYEDETKHPLDIFQHICDTVPIPAPNYVEYGHRLRMIYLFEEPLRLFPGQKGKLLRGFSFLQKCVCRMINEELDGMGCESNPPTSFFRMPGSVNTKTGDVVCIKHVTDERWTLQELFSEWIPDRYIDEFGLGKEYRKRKRKEKKKSVTDYNSCTLWDERMRVFERMQSEACPPRKRLCFLYGIGLYWTHRASTPEEVLAGVLEYNRGFQVPLPENVVRSRIRTIRPYKYTTGELASLLGVNVSLFQGLSRKERDKRRYLARKLDTGSKQDAMSCRREKVSCLVAENKTVSEVSLLLGISPATVRRDLSAIQKNRRVAVWYKRKRLLCYKAYRLFCARKKETGCVCGTKLESVRGIEKAGIAGHTNPAGLVGCAHFKRNGAVCPPDNRGRPPDGERKLCLCRMPKPARTHSRLLCPSG